MDRQTILRAAAGVALAALAVFLAVSLLTHDPHEGPFPDSPARVVVHNACGVAGACVSAYVLALLGWSAYLLAGAVLAAGLAVASGRRIRDPGLRVVGLGLLVGASTLGLAMLNASAASTPGLYRAGTGAAGGMLGILAATALYGAVGATGSLILLVLAGSLGLLLAAGGEAMVAARLCGSALARPRGPAKRPARQAAHTRRAVRSDQAPPAQEPAPEASSPVPGAAVIDRPAPREAPPEPELVTSFPPAVDVDDEDLDIDVIGEHLPDGDFQLPSVNLLDPPSSRITTGDEAAIREKSQLLERTLAEFRVDARVVRIQRGPVITMHELSLAPGTKVSKVEALADDLAIALKAPNVRIVAPLPGRNTVGIEVPNSERELVGLRELMDATRKTYNNLEIPLFLGKDTAGNPLVLDLASCPHLLVAGATGSGKSVAINAMISSILMTRMPEEVQLLLIDPKSVEFSEYARLPHLLCPVLTDMKKAAAVLKWACKKMDERYSVLSRAGVRNLTSYNELGEDEIIRRLCPEEDAILDDVPFRMPHIVIIVDEFGELMMVAAKEVESSVTRLSQKARAVGIHLVCATQRPSVDVITGLIKANLPARVAFQVSSKVDSRTILDRNGADLLLGRGDMLLLPPGSSRLVRAQGSYVSEEEVQRVVSFLESQGDPRFQAELREVHARHDTADHGDDLYDEAARIVIESQRGSVSLLQRRLSIGYSRAARLIDMMAEAGIVGPYRGSQARRVMMTTEEWEKAHVKS
jgi:S-DNA-T family DNA segregation ATPase FtsK/SpoIIIE